MLYSNIIKLFVYHFFQNRFIYILKQLKESRVLIKKRFSKLFWATKIWTFINVQYLLPQINIEREKDENSVFLVCYHNALNFKN